MNGAIYFDSPPFIIVSYILAAIYHATHIQSNTTTTTYTNTFTNGGNNNIALDVHLNNFMMLIIIII